MKKVLFLILISAIPLFCFANDISGSWFVIKTEKNGQVKEPYFKFKFEQSGKMFFMDIPFGTWKKEQDTILMTSKMSKDFNGTAKIVKSTDNELIIQNNGAKIYFEKYDAENTAENNKKSGISGNWKVKGDNSKTTILKLELPDKFTYIITDGEITDTYNGNWIYLINEKSLVFISMTPALRGKYKLEKTKNGISLIRKNEKLSLIKEGEKETLTKLERLNFKFEDFPEDIDENEKLPWKDFYEMQDFLSKHKKIKYKFGSLIPETESLTYDKFISEISVFKDRVVFTNFIVKNNKKEQISQKVKGRITNAYNYFFPLDEPMPHRIVGIKKLTVLAGTFDCTVVEGIDGEAKVKLWLINAMPGIYAKIIKEEKDPFGDISYTIKELTEIK